jgi:hypothetical protein
MSTENNASYKKPLPVPGAQKRYRTFEDLEVIRWLRERKQGASLELREDSPAYGLTDEQLDELLDGPFASTLHPIHASTTRP